MESNGRVEIYQERIDFADAMPKLDTARIILDRLTNEYGYRKEDMPTYLGARSWGARVGESTQQEKNSVKWMEDFEFLQTMFFILSDCVYDANKILSACYESENKKDRQEDSCTESTSAVVSERITPRQDDSISCAV